MSRTLRFVQAALLVAGVGIAMTACTTPVYAQRGGGVYSRDIDRQAYDNGYRDGVRLGENDARRGRSYSMQDHGEYRSADSGYRGQYGDREYYRRTYRQGFQSGYNEGFNRYANAGRYPRGNGYPSYPNGYPNPNTYPNYPGGVAVPRNGGYYGGSYGGQVGYRDGLEQGRNDARDRKAFDPVRAKRYRDADHDYNDRYGNKEQYKREYRTAFEQGYREGYGAGNNGRYRY